MTFVLVHGAYRGGWIWKRLVPLLREAGHDARVITLTGLGDRAHLLTPAVSLSTHLDDLVRFLRYEDLTDVALVGHSYGGMVITGVATMVPERVSSLVYLDAPVPSAGQSLFDLFSPARREELVALAASSGEGWRLPVAAAEPLGVTDPEDIAWMRPRLTAQPLATFREALPQRERSKDGPARTYISCTMKTGRASPVSRAADQVRGDTAWRYAELPTVHDAMVTMPADLARVLLGAT